MDPLLAYRGHAAVRVSVSVSVRVRVRVSVSDSDSDYYLKVESWWSNEATAAPLDYVLVVGRNASLDPDSQERLSEAGVQLYSGNFLSGGVVGWAGARYGQHSAVCLETQHVPDAPNRPEFASTVLRPGAVFRSETVYRFSG